MFFQHAGARTFSSSHVPDSVPIYLRVSVSVSVSIPLLLPVPIPAVYLVLHHLPIPVSVAIFISVLHLSALVISLHLVVYLPFTLVPNFFFFFSFLPSPLRVIHHVQNGYCAPILEAYLQQKRKR